MEERDETSREVKTAVVKDNVEDNKNAEYNDRAQIPLRTKEGKARTSKGHFRIRKKGMKSQHTTELYSGTGGSIIKGGVTTLQEE